MSYEKITTTHTGYESVPLKAILFITFCCQLFNACHYKGATYGNVAMGGGGFVSAIIPSKTEANLIYGRTNVGGAYRCDNVNGKMDTAARLGVG